MQPTLEVITKTLQLQDHSNTHFHTDVRILKGSYNCQQSHIILAYYYTVYNCNDLYINRGRYVHASVCRGKAARGEAALRAKARGLQRAPRLAVGHAAALRARGKAARETTRGKAASCRGKATRGEATYNLVFY